MQAIFTKYLPATDLKGSRVKAWAEAGSVTIPYDTSKDVEEAHIKAIWAFLAKFGWRGIFHVGAWDKGFVAVFRESCSTYTVPDDLKAEIKNILNH